LAVEPIGPVPAANQVSPVRVRIIVLPPAIMSDSTAVVTVPVRAQVHPALITVATKILAAATSPAFVVALTSKFCEVGSVIEVDICALSIFVTVPIALPPPSASHNSTSEVEPFAASACK